MMEATLDVGTGLEALIFIGLLGLGAGAGASITWWFLTRRRNGRHLEDRDRR